MPKEWKQLYDMLPDTRRLGNSWDPPLPLILGAWHDTPALQKLIRLREHMVWANEYGVLEAVDRYVRSILESGWFPVGEV